MKKMIKNIRVVCVFLIIHQKFVFLCPAAGVSRSVQTNS